MSGKGKRVCVLGATGTIGRATTAALIDRGHKVVCLVRTKPDVAPVPGGVIIKTVNTADPTSWTRNGFAGEEFDAVISCMASRTGTPEDAWAVDYEANLMALNAAQQAGVPQFVLLSAICVQKPLLQFQHAKLAFEEALITSGLRYSIVRPTAFFKSLSGQVERVRKGKPFLIFGDGTLTACKPISDHDLAHYLASCLDDENKWDRILPIGGPGDAITPKEQGEALFAMLDRPPKFRSVPAGFLRVIANTLGALGRFSKPLADKAELARIGHYYATQSMLVLDETTGQYDADATPSTGTQTLFGYYRDVLSGEQIPERGDHAVFNDG